MHITALLVLVKVVARAALSPSPSLYLCSFQSALVKYILFTLNVCEIPV